MYAHARRSEQCARLLGRLQTATISLVAPAVVWAELCHIYMLEEVRGSSRSFDVRLLGWRPERVKRLRLYRERIRTWSDLGLGYEPTTRDDLLEKGLDFQAKYGLLTHDSAILAAAVRRGRLPRQQRSVFLRCRGDRDRTSDGSAYLRRPAD